MCLYDTRGFRRHFNKLGVGSRSLRKKRLYALAAKPSRAAVVYSENAASGSGRDDDHLVPEQTDNHDHGPDKLLDSQRRGFQLHDHLRDVLTVLLPVQTA